MEIITKGIREIKPYEKNPRKNDAAVEYVANSIREFGFKVPIVIDKDGVIVCGHTRWKAAKKLGMKEVPCIMADDLSPEQIKAFRLADNKVGEMAEWDFDFLKEELEDIGDAFDMEDFGFLDELPEEPEPGTHEDEVPEEAPEEPKTKPGDMYRLGDHILLCGDATSVTDIDKVMQGEKADLVFTDPPYGMKKEKEGVTNDNLNYDDLLEFNRQWIPLTFGALKDNGSWYCWGIDEPLMDIYSNILKPMAKAQQVTFRNLITWDKGNGQGQLSEEFRSYPVADEKCLFVMAGVQGFNINQDNYYEEWEPIRSYFESERNKIKASDKEIANALGFMDGRTVNHWYSKSQFNFITSENYEKIKDYCKRQGIDAFKRQYDEIKRQYDEIKRQWYETRAYFNNTHDNMNNVWHFDRAGQEERTEHATPKPVALCARAIKSSSRKGEIVLDVFGGSGSTLIACEQLGRHCRMIEIEPKWCDVIIARWEKETGKTAELIQEGDSHDAED